MFPETRISKPFMKSNTRLRNRFCMVPAISSVAMGIASFIPPSSHAADGTWSGATSGAWLTGTNWSATPGVTGISTNNDIATFGVAANPAITIDMTSAGGNYSLGAISNTQATARSIGAATSAGVLNLYGATVNGKVDTIIRNSTSTLLTLQVGTAPANLSIKLVNDNNKITIDGGGGVTIGSLITGNGTLIKDGSGGGLLTLQNSVNTYSGGTIIKTGTLAIAVVANLPGYNVSGGVAAGAFSVESGATLALSNAVLPANVAVIGGTTGNFQAGSYLGFNGAGALTWSNAITGVQGLHKYGSSTLTLSVANTFAGDTKIIAGNLEITNSLALQNSALNTTSSNIGTGTRGLSTALSALTFGGLIGDKDLATVFDSDSGGYTGIAGLTLNPGTGVSNLYSGIIADGAAGMMLTKSGLGTQILAGENSYTGDTVIKAGILKINTSTSIDSSSEIIAGDVGSSGAVLDATTAGITVGSTQTLAGIGKVLATGQTLLASGTISAGDSSVGTLSIDGGELTLDGTSKFTFALGTTSDLVSLLNSVTLNLGTNTLGLTDFTFSNSGGFGAGIYTLISGASAFTGSLDGSDLIGSVNGLSSTLSMSGNNLILTAVPEPSAAILGGLGMLALLRRRR